MSELDQDDEVDVVVLTGADPAFCAGLDLKELGEGGAALALGSSPDGSTPVAPWSAIGKPVIGAVKSRFCSRLSRSTNTDKRYFTHQT